MHTANHAPQVNTPRHLQAETMEIKVPPGALMRTLCITSSDQTRRRLTTDQREAMRGLWKLSKREALQAFKQAQKQEHTQDEHCTVDPNTDCCSGCGVHHAEPCRVCGGRGFHRPNCSEMSEG